MPHSIPKKNKNKKSHKATKTRAYLMSPRPSKLRCTTFGANLDVE